MTFQKVIAAPREYQEFQEIFNCSFPSACNIYLAGRGNIIYQSPDIRSKNEILGRVDNHCYSSGAVLRFASEGHSLTLLHSDDDNETSKSCGGDKNSHRFRVGDEYFLSVHRFPTIASGKQCGNKLNDEKSKNKSFQNSAKAADNMGNKSAVCLAHSAIDLACFDLGGNGTYCLNIEVFAMMGVSVSGNQCSDIVTLGPANDPKSSTTTGSIDNHAQDTVDHNSMDASVSTKGNAAADGSGSGGKNLENNKYFLTVKTRLSLNRPNHASRKGRVIARKHDENSENNMERISDAEERIALEVEEAESQSQVITRVDKITVDFRPVLVYVGDLYFKSDDLNENRNRVIGIFLTSADDNKLRLFIASCEKLRSWCMKKVHNNISCFDQVSLSNAFDSLKSNEPQDPFVFPSQIMSLATCVAIKRTAVWNDCGEIQFLGREAGSAGDIANKLAVACYDGTICVYTYNLDMATGSKGSTTDGHLSNKTDDSKSISSVLRIINLEQSTLVVDGPVVALHFGNATVPAFNGTDEVTESNFLVVGSLCGFACLFYELPRNAPDTAVEFCGPVTIVDGLYDSHGEGFDDCVTAVHACCSEGAQLMIAVGTQSGRVLLFQPVLPIKVYCKATTEKKHAKMKYLRGKIEELRDEISFIDGNLTALNERIEEYRKSIFQSSNKSSLESNGAMDGNDTPTKEATIGVSGAIDVVDENCYSDGKSKHKSWTLKDGVQSPHNVANAPPAIFPGTKQSLSQHVHAFSPIDEMIEQRENDEMTGIRAECIDDTDIAHNKTAQTHFVVDKCDQYLDDRSQHSLRVKESSQLDSQNDGVVPKMDSLVQKEENRAKDCSCLVVDSSTTQSSDFDASQATKKGMNYSGDTVQNETVYSPIKDELFNLSENLKSIEKQRSRYEDQKQAVLSSITQLELQVKNLDERSQIFCKSSYLDSMRKMLLFRRFYRYEFAWENQVPYPINGISFVKWRNKETLDILVSTRRGIHAFRKNT